MSGERTPLLAIRRDSSITSLRRLQTRRRAQRGTSLIEVMIALFVIVVGLLPSLSLCGSSCRLSQQAQLRAAAYNSARDQMESLRALQFASRTTETTQSFTIPSAVTTQFPNARMTGTYMVVPLSTTLQQVIVQVSWRNASANAPTSTIRLNTIVAQEPGK
jgi:type IV pilus modification protein PilV